MKKDRQAVFYRRIVKPWSDRIIAFVVLILASPVFLLLILLLSIANKGKVFFFQVRPGRGERIFKVIKFKTMTDERGVQGQLLPDENRLTAVGKFVRRTSLDEIPQLINVFKGDMSLIGPRPLLEEYLPLYDPVQRRRHEVKPGITGWAQVNGRNAISWRQKFEYDVWYVDNLSFSLDMKIAWLTVLKVFRSEGINSSNSATVEKFVGNKEI